MIFLPRHFNNCSNPSVCAGIMDIVRIRLLGQG